MSSWTFPKAWMGVEAGLRPNGPWELSPGFTQGKPWASFFSPFGFGAGPVGPKTDSTQSKLSRNVQTAGPFEPQEPRSIPNKLSSLGRARVLAL
jgi:hypothetical protein